MEIQQAKARKFILNYGFLLGILMVLLGVIMYVTNNHLSPHWSFIVINFAFFIGAVAIATKAYKKENGGFLSIGEAIKIGVGIALIAAILTGIWTLLLTSVIEPDYMTQAAESQREMMLERFPEMTNEQLDKAAETNAKFNKPWFAFTVGIVTNLFFGLLIGLITGLIMKQSRPYDN